MYKTYKQVERLLKAALIDDVYEKYCRERVPYIVSAIERSAYFDDCFGAFFTRDAPPVDISTRDISEFIDLDTTLLRYDAEFRVREPVLRHYREV